VLDVATHKQCKLCKQAKLSTLEFWYKAKSLDGLGYYCKICTCENSKKWRANNHDKSLEIHRKYNRTHSRSHEKKTRRDYTDWRRRLLNRAKKRSRETGLPCDLDIAFLTELMSSQAGRCYYTGTLIDTVRKPKNPLGPSLDRVDSKLGYTKANVVISCLWVNYAKNDFSSQEFQELLKRIDLVSKPAF
jgi:hypothetical protein